MLTWSTFTISHLSGVSVLISSIVSLQYGKTALHQACKYGHEEVVHTLIKAGATIDKTDGVSNVY